MAVFFEDSDSDGIIATEDSDPANSEVLQRHFYYSFGMEMQGAWVQPSAPENQYMYNGKELHEDLGLDWYEYGARMYDAAVGRFTGVDPIADQYAFVTVYNYVENEPIGHIDLWGLQKTVAQRTGTAKPRQIGTRTDVGPTINGVPISRIPRVPGTEREIQEAEYRYEKANIDAQDREWGPGNSPQTINAPSTAPRNIYLESKGLQSRIISLSENKNSITDVVYFYLAMSMGEYTSTGGFLSDLRTSGEGPHVRRNIEYLLNAKFIQRVEYDVIIRYAVSNEVAAIFDLTPFVFIPKPGKKGNEVFNPARECGMWYKKYENGISYGFPGSSTALFNASIIGNPEIYKSKKDGKFTN